MEHILWLTIPQGIKPSPAVNQALVFCGGAQEEEGDAWSFNCWEFIIAVPPSPFYHLI